MYKPKNIINLPDPSWIAFSNHSQLWLDRMLGSQTIKPPDPKKVAVIGRWTKDVEKYIRHANVESIYFNYSWGWEGTDFSFLSQVDVKELDFVCLPSTGLNAIEEVSSLEKVSFQLAFEDKIDFTRLKNLRDIYLPWQEGVESILECRGLRRFAVKGPKTKNYEPLRKMIHLELLEIMDGNLSSLEFLDSCAEITALSLTNCRRIKNFEPIGQLAKLQQLTFQSMSALNSLEFCRKLQRLENLLIAGCQELESARPLKKLQNVKKISLTGSSFFTDGDISAFCSLPKLMSLWLTNKKHYSHKVVRKATHDDFTEPDFLIVKK